jgi:ApaG protein
MVYATTDDITVSVDIQYQPQYSVPHSAEFLFAYHINIINNSSQEIQILARHWFIADGPVQKREVKGEGIVGEQPVLAPGEQHAYVSFCNLAHPFGSMQGVFFASRITDGYVIEIEVPLFTMILPQLLS